MSDNPFDDPAAPSPWPEGATIERPKAAGTQIKTPHAFPVVWVSDAELDLSGRPILKGLIDPGGFVVIYGPAGSGKSFFTADIAQHIATGNPWRGRKVRQSLVVYVASEAGSSIIKRFVAWRDNRMGDSVGRLPLAILTRGPNLLASVDVEKLCELLCALRQEAGLALGLVVFDTLSRSIPGGDENSAEDMTMPITAADLIRERFGAAVVYVHHSGKDPSKGARGHSALFAAADLVLGISEGVATTEKVRDGVAGEHFPFTLEPIEVGTDCDGDAVMTCLLNATDAICVTKRQEPTGKNQRIVLKELRALAADAEVSPGTSEIPRGARFVTFDALAEKASPRFAGVATFRARARIAEAVSSLQASGFAGVHGGLVWLL